jgi:hypothetical protein
VPRHARRAAGALEAVAEDGVDLLALERCQHGVERPRGVLPVRVEQRHDVVAGRGAVGDRALVVRPRARAIVTEHRQVAVARGGLEPEPHEIGVVEAAGVEHQDHGDAGAHSGRDALEHPG